MGGLLGSVDPGHQRKCDFCRSSEKWLSKHWLITKMRMPMTGYSNKRKVLLHIGWPKTGTTTVQKHGFNLLSGYRYLGKVPFETEKERIFFQLTHLVAYASPEKFETMHGAMFRALVQLEEHLFGSVDVSIPAIISEEAFLSVLLKPSDHQHHGYSTASLNQVIERLAKLEELWNVSFEIMITERDPMELLHAYYAQLYHIIRRFDGLKTFRGYLEVGTKDMPARDLGFRYLRTGVVSSAFREQFGEEHVHVIHMKQLFLPGQILLSRWYPGLPDMPLRDSEIENRRSVEKGVKVAHLRPLWEKRAKFRLKDLITDVRQLYKMRYGSHAELEVMIKAEEKDVELVRAFMNDRAE